MCDKEINLCPKCHKKCEEKNGIVYCKSDQCCWGEVKPSAVRAARSFASELVERVSHLTEIISPLPGEPLYEEFLCKYNSFNQTVKFLKLLASPESNSAYSTLYTNYLRLYREGEELRSVMDILEKMEGTR